MKVTYEFDSDEDTYELSRFQKLNSFISALYMIDQLTHKYDEMTEEQMREALEKIRNHCFIINE